MVEFRTLALLRFRPDVLHLQEHSAKIGLGGLLRSWTSIVMTVHDPLPHFGRDEAVAAKGRAIRFRTRSMVSGLIVQGTYCKAIALGRLARPASPVEIGPDRFRGDHGREAVLNEKPGSNVPGKEE